MIFHNYVTVYQRVTSDSPFSRHRPPRHPCHLLLVDEILCGLVKAAQLLGVVAKKRLWRGPAKLTWLVGGFQFVNDDYIDIYIYIDD